MTLEDFFPEGYSPRESQQLLLESLEPLLKDTTKKYIILRAPTGIGKSALCTTISNYFSSLDKSSYVLCSRKYLQTQYMDDFSKTYTNFWGKNNYTCPLISASCSGCPADNAVSPEAYMRFLRSNCTIPKTKIGSKCPYIRAKMECASAPSSLLNIEAFLANSLQGTWEKREMMIVDEAHVLSDRAAGFFEVKLNDLWIPRKYYTKLFSQDKHAKFPKRYYLGEGEVLSKIVKKLTMKIEATKAADLPVPIDLTNSVNYLSIKGISWVYDSHNRSLIPINVKNLLEKYLLSYADKVIFMSATVSPNLCKELGINSKNSTFLDIDSSFPKNNHTLKYDSGIGNLNASNIATNIEYISNSILKARIENENTRGIVHSTSYNITQSLATAITSLCNKLDTTAEEQGFIFHTRDQKLEELLEKYRNSPNSVLVTPSLCEGFDGKGDLLRWQVLVKCPYPYLGDPRIKAYTETKFGSTLFRERAISTLLQTLGRGIRSNTDTCTSYILDKNIATVLSGCSRKSSPHYTSTSQYFKDLWKSRIVCDNRS